MGNETNDPSLSSSNEEQTAQGSPINVATGIGSSETTQATSAINETQGTDPSVPIISAINPAEAKTESNSDVSTILPTTSSTPIELSSETPTSPLPVADNIINVQMEATPVTVAPAESSTVINQTDITNTSAPAEPSVSTSTSNTLLKTESDSSTINEIKEKEGRFSKFLERVSESKIGQSLNLPELKEAVEDFAKTTRSQVLGNIPSLEKIKTSPGGINQFKESFKESINAFKESSKTEKAMSIVDKTKDFFSNMKKDTILESTQPIFNEVQRTETVEKSAPTVIPAPAPNLLTTATQNETTQSNTNNILNQSTQTGGETSQTIQTATQQNVSTASQPTGVNQPNQPASTQVNMSTAEMERTLRNIEFHLLNGIEVTVKSQY